MKTTKKLHDALLDYEEMFGDFFPTMFFMSLTDEELLEMVLECIDSGEPCKVELPEGALS